METYKTDDSENSSPSCDSSVNAVKLSKQSTDEEYDSDETFCELGEIPTVQDELQSVYEEFKNGEEMPTKEQLIDYLENVLEGDSTGQHLTSENLHCENFTEDFQFTETALFDEQNLKNSGFLDVFLSSNSLNTSTNEPQPIDKKNDSMSAGDTLMEGLTENLQGIIGSRDLQSFVENFSPIEVVKPCSPPLTLNKPPLRRRFPATKVLPDLEFTMTKKTLPIRKSSSPYIKTRIESYTHEKIRKKRNEVSKDTLPERKYSPSKNLETRKRRTLYEKTVNSIFKHNKTKDFKPSKQMGRTKADTSKQNIEMYNKIGDQNLPLEPSRNEMKRKGVGRKNVSDKLKMDVHKIEEKLAKITTKANLWLNGTGYHPSRDEAFKMLEDAKILISHLETFKKKSIVGRRKESHKIKEDLLMEAANKLATAINIAIEESDHLLRSELSEIISKDEELDINDSKNSEEECTSEGFKLKNRETFELKPILKYNKSSTELSESVKKHIYFSEDLEECYYISKESDNSEHSLCDSNHTINEENSVSILMEKGKSQEENVNVISSTLCTNTIEQQSKEITLKISKTTLHTQSTNKQNNKKSYLTFDNKKEKLELDQVKCSYIPSYLFPLHQKSDIQLYQAIQCSDERNKYVSSNSEDCNHKKGVNGLEDINTYEKETSVFETELCPNIRPVPTYCHLEGTCNNHVEGEECNNDKMEINSVLAELTTDNDSVVFTEEILLRKPESWSKITIMSVKAVRAKDPSDYTPIKNIPKDMIDSMDWFF